VLPDWANFFFGHTFDIVSVKSINYACAVKNDTPLYVQWGSKCRWDLSPEELEIETSGGDSEVINKKL